MNYNNALQELVDSINIISEDKQYWFLRTQSGSMYDLFLDTEIVGIEHNEIALQETLRLYNVYGKNKKEFTKEYKSQLEKFYKNEIESGKITNQKIGVIASQVHRFLHEIKAGDYVLIPSANSSLISIGEIVSSEIKTQSKEELEQSKYNYPLIKEVKWIKQLKKHQIDPLMYKMFTNHQAISNVSNYKEIIERTLNDMYILGDRAHTIIEVENDEIKAKHLFGLGYELLNLVDEFCIEYNIDVDTNDIDVSVNINSPGRIDLKSLGKTSAIIAGIILFSVGGGFKKEGGNFSLTTEGVPGLINAVSDFLDRKHEREQNAKNLDIRHNLILKYADSLSVKTPEDLVKIIKQFDENKDLPK